MNALDILLSEKKLPEISTITPLQEIFITSLKKGATLNFDQITNSFNLSTEISTLFKNWLNNICNLSFLEQFLNQNHFEEIIISSNLSALIIGNSKRTPITLDNINTYDFKIAIEYLILNENIKLNFSEPFVSFKKTVGDCNFRISITHPCISSEGLYKINLRKISNTIFPIESYFVDKSCQQIVTTAFKEKKNMIIAGSTGSGKTSFLSSLIQFSKDSEHILILEDTDEITRPNQLASKLLANKSENKTLKDYCSYALRLSPSRLILGEIRSSEVVSYTLLMNCGHRGLISTIHSDNAIDVISRMSLLFSLYSDNPNIGDEQIKKLICKNIDMVIYLDNKKVKEVIEVVGFSGNQIIVNDALDKSII